MKWLIIICYTCILLISGGQLHAQNNQSAEKEFHFIDVQVGGVDTQGYEFLEKYDRFSVDTQLSLWVKFKLIRPAQIKKLHQLYPTASANLFMRGLLSPGPVCIYRSIRYSDGMCTYRRYDTSVIIDLLTAIASEKPDSIQWLCNKLIDSFEVAGYDGSGTSDTDVRNRIEDFRQYDDEDIYKYAERNGVTLPVERCFSKIEGEPVESPVTGELFLRPYSIPYISYLLSLKNPVITKRLKGKIVLLYKGSGYHIDQSLEYHEFKKHGEVFTIPPKKKKVHQVHPVYKK